MNSTVTTPIKTRYLDTVTLQILIDSGEYASARDAARAQGIEFAAGAYDRRLATMRQAIVASGQDNMNYSNAA